MVIGLGEDPERATQRILERTADPIVVDLQLEGEALLEQSPLRLPDLYAGAPAMISVKLAPTREIWAEPLSISRSNRSDIRARRHRTTSSSRASSPKCSQGVTPILSTR